MRPRGTAMLTNGQRLSVSGVAQTEIHKRRGRFKAFWRCSQPNSTVWCSSVSCCFTLIFIALGVWFGLEPES